MKLFFEKNSEIISQENNLGKDKCRLLLVLYA